ncbi:hypothetical protein H2203_002438 [Taxawa tesnikishii (nom. ined.)]|nr:hypothetical protein H2203_002438 [Dothideales sp. JES 119]
MDGASESTPPNYRVGGLKGFLPLSDEASISTRGQHLPALIKNRSSTNIVGLQRTYSGIQRRRSSLDGSFTRPRRSEDSDSEQDVEAQRPSLESARQEYDGEPLDRRVSVLMTPQMRSQRLIGNSNPRYRWEQYYKTEEQLKKMRKPIREYYERNNYLIQQYLYIDRLLDSSLPHNLIQEYSHHHDHPQPHVPPTICEEQPTPSSSTPPSPEIHARTTEEVQALTENGNLANKKIKRTPQDLYRVQDENTPLLTNKGEDEDDVQPIMPPYEPEEETDSQHGIVTVAIYINMAANTVLLIMKIIVTLLTSSVSVLASLVDAALDFLSTAIIWTTTRLISRNDQYAYPVGRRRLEPLGVLVFSVIMITSFVQVALEGLQKLTGPDHDLVKLTIPAIAIMGATVVIKLLCWFWCRLINNSSVQALAQDAMTDVVFNTFSIIFPLIGYYARVWWLDPLGGILLSLYVIVNWSRTSASHIRNLTGAAASADERNVLLYLTMRFAKTIKQIQGLQAYHAGDKLNVEVDIVLDENTSLRDSHDLGESLQYVLESVPTVDRAFVHQDYASWNLPSHMQQQV